MASFIEEHSATDVISSGGASSRFFHDQTFSSLTAEKCVKIESCGFSIIDNFLDEDLAGCIRGELISLSQTSGVMLPNRTHFSSPSNPSKHHLFAKPGKLKRERFLRNLSKTNVICFLVGIYEVDMHQTEVRDLVPHITELFHHSKTAMVKALQRYGNLLVLYRCSVLLKSI
jgi:hypothetical protein